MQEEKITIRDAFSNVVIFKTLSELENFIEYEAKAWSWLENARHNPNDMNALVSQGYREVKVWIQNVRNNQWSERELSNSLDSLYATANPTLLISDVEPGIGVQTIRDRHGEDTGEIAYALVTSRSSWNPANNLRAAKVWTMLACPALVGPTATVDEHRRKLGALRGSFRRTIDDARLDHATLLAEHKRSLLEDKGRYQRIALRMTGIGAARADRIAGSIRRTKARSDALHPYPSHSA